LQGDRVGVATALSPATVGHFKFLFHLLFVGLGLIDGSRIIDGERDAADEVPGSVIGGGLVIDDDGYSACAESRQSAENPLGGGERHDESCAAGDRSGADLSELDSVAHEVDYRQTEAQIGKAVAGDGET